MEKRMKRMICAGLCLLMLCSLLPVTAEAAETENMAQDVSNVKLVESASGCESVSRLFDGYRADFVTLRDGARLTLSREEGIGSLYILFGWEYGSYTVTNEATGQSESWGGNGILHEFLDLEAAFGEAPERVTLAFDDGSASITEIYAFSSGQVPDHVQKWEPAAEGAADIVLFSTHGDDEQLFFAGLIPYYAAELGYQVQVVYMTDHRNVTLRRVGEMLDGLWAVGLRTYPVFGSFGDYLTTNREETYKKYASKDITQEDILAYVVENIRRFRPKVAIGHDLNGEYGHGMHMVYADALCEAAEIASDASQFPESAEKYGVWDVPKTYLHLYEENPIVMDWDQPLESFDGMTAYEVTKDLGFPCHGSQQDYYKWYFIGNETAADIIQYSPREFGLYRTTVGADVQKNDFFENVTTHAQDAAEEQPQEEETIPPEEMQPAVETVTQAVEETVHKEAPDEAEHTGSRTRNLPVVIAAGVMSLVIYGAIIEFWKRRRVE